MLNVANQIYRLTITPSYAVDVRARLKRTNDTLQLEVSIKCASQTKEKHIRIYENHFISVSVTSVLSSQEEEFFLDEIIQLHLNKFRIWFLLRFNVFLDQQYRPLYGHQIIWYSRIFEIRWRPFTDNIMTVTVDFNEILDTKPACLKANLTQHETSVLFIPLKLWTIFITDIERWISLPGIHGSGPGLKRLCSWIPDLHCLHIHYKYLLFLHLKLHS